MMTGRRAYWIPPLALSLIAIFAYGVFAFQLGFHWDDWGFVWLIRALGRPGLFDYFATNRPFLAYVYSITTSLFGTTPWAWHLFSLFWRWCSAVSLLALLRLIWPERRLETFLAVVFFLVYPGFNQQAVAITYSHFFLAQTLLFLSMILMLRFASQPRRAWWAGVLGVGFSLVNLFSTEYFFGLELLRPALLWLALGQRFPDQRARIRRAMLAYLPFILALAGYLYWRILVLGFYHYQLQLGGSAGTTFASRLAALPTAILEQWKVTSWGAWTQVFQLPDFSAYGPRLTVVYLFVTLITAIGLYLLASRTFQPNELEWRFSPTWLGLGLLSLLLAGVPFLVTDLPVRLTFPNSRFTLPFAFGTALLLVTLLGLVPPPVHRLALAGLLAALAVGLQFNNGYLWRQDWQLQKAFFWQMIWRVPALQPGTILLSSDTPFDYLSDNSLTFPLNLTYAPDNHTTDLYYAYFFVSVRLGHELEALKPGLAIHQDYLAAGFDSTSDQMVAVHFNPPGCFRALHPIYDRDLPLAPASGVTAERWLQAGVPILPRAAVKALPLSKPDQIVAGEVAPFPVLGLEPQHTWCYYFEKADLARQEGDWTMVAEIGDQAFVASYQPDDASEYLPFIEGYARTGRWEEARELTRKSADLMPLLRPALCAVWERVSAVPDTGITADRVERMKAELGYCPYPEE